MPYLSCTWGSEHAEEATGLKLLGGDGGTGQKQTNKQTQQQTGLKIFIYLQNNGF